MPKKIFRQLAVRTLLGIATCSLFQITLATSPSPGGVSSPFTPNVAITQGINEAILTYLENHPSVVGDNNNLLAVMNFLKSSNIDPNNSPPSARATYKALQAKTAQIILNSTFPPNQNFDGASTLEHLSSLLAQSGHLTGFTPYTNDYHPSQSGSRSTNQLGEFTENLLKSATNFLQSNQFTLEDMIRPLNDSLNAVANERKTCLRIAAVLAIINHNIDEQLRNLGTGTSPLDQEKIAVLTAQKTKYTSLINSFAALGFENEYWQHLDYRFNQGSYFSPNVGFEARTILENPNTLSTNDDWRYLGGANNSPGYVDHTEATQLKNNILTILDELVPHSNSSGISLRTTQTLTNSQPLTQQFKPITEIIPVHVFAQATTAAYYNDAIDREVSQNICTSADSAAQCETKAQNSLNQAHTSYQQALSTYQAQPTTANATALTTAYHHLKTIANGALLASQYLQDQNNNTLSDTNRNLREQANRVLSSAIKEAPDNSTLNSLKQIAEAIKRTNGVEYMHLIPSQTQLEIDLRNGLRNIQDQITIHNNQLTSNTQNLSNLQARLNNLLHLPSGNTNFSNITSSQLNSLSYTDLINYYTDYAKLQTTQIKINSLNQQISTERDISNLFTNLSSPTTSRFLTDLYGQPTSPPDTAVNDIFAANTASSSAIPSLTHLAITNLVNEGNIAIPWKLHQQFGQLINSASDVRNADSTQMRMLALFLLNQQSPSAIPITNGRTLAITNAYIGNLTPGEFTSTFPHSDSVALTTYRHKLQLQTAMAYLGSTENLNQSNVIKLINTKIASLAPYLTKSSSVEQNKINSSVDDALQALKTQINRNGWTNVQNQFRGLSFENNYTPQNNNAVNVLKVLQYPKPPASSLIAISRQNINTVASHTLTTLTTNTLKPNLPTIPQNTRTSTTVDTPISDGVFTIPNTGDW